MEAFVHQFKGYKNVTGFPFTAAALKLPAGAWLVFAKADVTTISPFHLAMGMECHLLVGNASDKVFVVHMGAADHTQIETIALNVGVKLAEEGAVELSCLAASDNSMRIQDITITALSVDDVTITVEQGEEDTTPHTHHDFWGRRAKSA
jgi:hypothetical protein